MIQGSLWVAALGILVSPVFAGPAYWNLGPDKAAFNPPSALGVFDQDELFPNLFATGVEDPRALRSELEKAVGSILGRMTFPSGINSRGFKEARLVDAIRQELGPGVPFEFGGGTVRGAIGMIYHRLLKSYRAEPGAFDVRAELSEISQEKENISFSDVVGVGSDVDVLLPATTIPGSSPVDLESRLNQILPHVPPGSYEEAVDQISIRAWIPHVEVKAEVDQTERAFREGGRVLDHLLFRFTGHSYGFVAPPSRPYPYDPVDDVLMGIHRYVEPARGGLPTDIDENLVRLVRATMDLPYVRIQDADDYLSKHLSIEPFGKATLSDKAKVQLVRAGLSARDPSAFRRWQESPVGSWEGKLRDYVRARGVTVYEAFPKILDSIPNTMDRAERASQVPAELWVNPKRLKARTYGSIKRVFHGFRKPEYGLMHERVGFVERFGLEGGLFTAPRKSGSRNYGALVNYLDLVDCQSMRIPDYAAFATSDWGRSQMEEAVRQGTELTWFLAHNWGVDALVNDGAEADAIMLVVLNRARVRERKAVQEMVQNLISGTSLGATEVPMWIGFVAAIEPFARLKQTGFTERAKAAISTRLKSLGPEDPVSVGRALIVVEKHRRSNPRLFGNFDVQTMGKAVLKSLIAGEP
ncbi:MAG: hypothetical protein AAB425_02165, partial [Bdellovibrionota bacterium]